MSDATAPPKYPAGDPPADVTPGSRTASIAEIEAMPARLRGLIADLDHDQLGAKYVNWSIRQIVSHLADSHMNAFVRFKLALTEANPTIKGYKEWDWSLLPDAAEADPELSIRLLEALHARWSVLLHGMSESDFAKTFHHPERAQDMTLDRTLAIYAWHGRHHGAQIEQIKGRHGW